MNVNYINNKHIDKTMKKKNITVLHLEEDGELVF